jgi:hypothetical protein
MGVKRDFGRIPVCPKDAKKLLRRFGSGASHFIDRA